MAEPMTIHLVGTNCNPEKEYEFNIWYSTHHAPLVLRGPAVAAERYERIGDSQQYPKYLAFYEYQSEKALVDYMKSPLREEALQDIRDSWPEAGDHSQVWSVSYKRLAKRGNDEYSLAFSFIGTNVPLNTDEAEFNDWYTNDHMVFMLRNPYTLRAERFQRIGDDDIYPKYLAIYRFENEATLAEGKKHFLSSGLPTIDRQRRWPDWVWRRVWGRVCYKLISRERKDLVV